MLVDIDEVKEYLRVDHEDEDNLLLNLICSAEQLCCDVLRVDELPTDNGVVRSAVYYAVGYLYENRGPVADAVDLTNMLKSLLSSSRKEVF